MSENKADAFHLFQFLRHKFRKTSYHGNLCIRVQVMGLANGSPAFFLGNRRHNTGADHINISEFMEILELESLVFKLSGQGRSFRKVHLAAEMMKCDGPGIHLAKIRF